jgi:hypothetical protein
VITGTYVSLVKERFQIRYGIVRHAPYRQRARSSSCSSVRYHPDFISYHRSVFDLGMFVSSKFRFIVFLILVFAGFAASNDGEDTETFPSATVVCETTKGQFVIDVYKEWSPLGAERFLHLVHDGFFTDIAFFRAVDGFLTQFGISDNPDLLYWHDNTIADDPNLNMGIHKNYVSFAGGGSSLHSSI